MAHKSQAVPLQTKTRSQSSNTPVENDCSLSLNDIDSKLDRICATLSQQIDGVKSELVSQMNESTVEFNNKIYQVETKVSSIDTRLSSDLESMRKENELIISGIPYMNGEHLLKIYADFSSNLGYVQNITDVDNEHIFMLPMVETMRLKPAGDNQTSPPILLRFETAFAKNNYFQRYLKHCKNLTLNSIPGFNGDSRVFVQHNLCSTYYKVHKRARALKKDNLVKSIKISHGRVAVKFNNVDQYKIFYSVDELDAAVNG